MGYPREVAQGEEFEKAIAPCKHILYFEVSDDCMTGRLLKRAETSGRADDNVETIKKRLVTFHQHSEPVIAAYKAKCSVIPAERSVDEIFADVTAALEKCNSWIKKCKYINSGMDPWIHTSHYQKKKKKKKKKGKKKPKGKKNKRKKKPK